MLHGLRLLLLLNLTRSFLNFQTSEWQVDLCCHVQYRPSVGHYHNYGAAMSEVEIDLLTGEVQVVAAHVLYDCGRSLNPAIDLGQVRQPPWFCFSEPERSDGLSGIL
jgi:CO/xanthine dehydrogenase Mo-binding subunit